MYLGMLLVPQNELNQLPGAWALSGRSPESPASTTGEYTLTYNGETFCSIGASSEQAWNVPKVRTGTLLVVLKLMVILDRVNCSRLSR